MEEKITSRQAILLVTICRIITTLTTMPTLYVEPANQDIWIVIIVSFFYTILTAVPVLYLSSKFNELNFIGYVKEIFGSIIGKVIGISYIIFYLQTAVLYLYISIQMIRVSFLPETKPIVVMILLVISCVYIASKGGTTIGRYSELLVPVILSIISVFIILGYNNVDLSALLPIYKDSTFWDINYGAIKLTYLFLDFSVLIMISPKLENKNERTTIFIKSVLYSLIFILITTIVTQASLGIEQAKHSNFPFLTYIRLINAFSLFERVESVYVIIWVFTMTIKVTTYIHIANEGMKEVFKKESGNKYLYVLGIICILSSFYLSDINPKPTAIPHSRNWEYIYYFVHKSLIPLIALLVYFIRKKTLGSQEKLQS